MVLTRPMLAATARNEDLDRLRYPLYASPKLDGIRCIIHPVLGPVTRSFKPVRNNYIGEMFSKFPKGLDGEIIIVDPETRKPLDFNTTQSHVMTVDGCPTNVEYWTFDWLQEFEPSELPWTFVRRYGLMVIHLTSHPTIRVLGQEEVRNANDVRSYASKALQDGFEGVVLRDPHGLYKCGRSTLKQQGMIKYKQFEDAEGVITGFDELYRNKNVLGLDNFGLAKRSSEKDGMVPANTLGALVLDTKWGPLCVGTGFDASLRQHIWENRELYLGKTVTFKYQSQGMADLPRFPVFLRFRMQE